MAYQIFHPPKANLIASAAIKPSWKVSFFLTGLSTPTPVYTTSALTTTHTQPVQADAGGVLPTIFLDPSIVYKATITDENDVLQYTEDPVNDSLLSQGIIGALLYPRTAAEIAAGVTPVNYAYPPGDVLRYGVNAVPGTTDMTAAFTAARTVTSGRYNISVPGVYLVDASPDVWADCFTACGGASIKIGVTTYDVSNAFAGRLRYVAASNELLWIKDAKEDDLVIGIQNNVAGRATYFNRGLSITSDSHAIQMLPTGATDSIDILMQRSTLNADPSGNRFSFTYDQVNDRWQFSYATSASGAPAFDTWMECGAGLAPYLHFPSLQPQFQQGYSIKRRAAGGLCIECFGDATTVRWRNQDTPANINMIFGDNAIAFLGATPAARQSITGTTADEKIDSVIALLVAFGLGTDNTT
jgi:hypothetical protein